MCPDKDHKLITKKDLISQKTIKGVDYVKNENSIIRRW